MSGIRRFPRLLEQQMSDPARAMLRNSAAVISTGAAVRAVGFATFILLSRGLAPADLGIYALVLTTVEVVRQITEWGIGTATIKRLKSVEDRAWRETIAASLTLRCIAATVGFGIVAGITLHPAMGPHRPLFVVGALTLFTSAVTESLTVPFVAALALDRLVRLKLAIAVLSLLAIALGVQRAWSVSEFLSAFVVLEALLALGTALHFASRFRLRFRRLLVHARPLTRDAAALGVLGVVVLLYFRLDVFMLQVMSGAEAVGQYSLAFRISEAFLLLTAAVSASTFPRFVELARTDAPALARFLSTIYRWGIVLATASSLVVALAAPRLITWLSPAYAEAGRLTALLIWSTVFMCANVQTANVLIATHRTHVVTMVAVGNLLLNVLANLVLIPRLGAFGAALATVLTEGVNAAVQYGYVRYWLAMPIPTGAWLLTAGAACIALFAGWTGLWLPTVATLGMVVIAYRMHRGAAGRGPIGRLRLALPSSLRD